LGVIYKNQQLKSGRRLNHTYL